jgi:LmbE family N-acetylglucosaminyl deacetylase
LRKHFAAVALSLFLVGSLYGTSTPAQPDDRMKADVLLIVAHPDDETGVSAYLAKLLDGGKRVAAVYLTRGDAGHNNMGSERARSLGLVRETELRRSMTAIGVENVWFLNCPDTPSQNVLRSLADWHHGAALEDVVRIVRLTRPEVVFTWLPAFRIGENHGDHQAAGVLATEAFDISGDPAIFPAQLAGPVAVNEMLLEGLHPWQIQKLYYFSDAADDKQFKGTGPSLPVNEVSTVRHLPYWRVAFDAFAYHLTQYRDYIQKMQAMNEQELNKKAESDWAQPIQLIFGKSAVKASPTGDPFEGTSKDAIPFVRNVPESPSQPPDALAELAGPWGFYEVFGPEHGLHLPHLSVQEISIPKGSTLTIPLTLHNVNADPKTFTVSITAPAGWATESGAGEYSIGSHTSAAVTLRLTAPATDAGTLQEIVCRINVPGQTPTEIKLQVKLQAGGLPQ